MSTKTYTGSCCMNTENTLYITKPNRRHKNGDWNDNVAPGDCSQSCALNVQDLVNKFGYERYKIMWVTADNEDIVFDQDPEGHLSKKSMDELSAAGTFRHIFVYDTNTNKIIDKSQGKILFESLETCKARYIHRYQGKFKICSMKLTDIKKDCEKLNIPSNKIFKYSFLNQICGHIITYGETLSKQDVINMGMIYKVIENPNMYNHNCPKRVMNKFIKDMTKDK